MQAQSNALAKEIGNLFREGKTREANELKEKTAGLKIRAKEFDENETFDLSIWKKACENGFVGTFIQCGNLAVII